MPHHACHSSWCDSEAVVQCPGCSAFYCCTVCLEHDTKYHGHADVCGRKPACVKSRMLSIDDDYSDDDYDLQDQDVSQNVERWPFGSKKEPKQPEPPARRESSSEQTMRRGSRMSRRGGDSISRTNMIKPENISEEDWQYILSTSKDEAQHIFVFPVEKGKRPMWAVVRLGRGRYNKSVTKTVEELMKVPKINGREKAISDYLVFFGVGEDGDLTSMRFGGGSMKIWNSITGSSFMLSVGIGQQRNNATVKAAGFFDEDAIKRPASATESMIVIGRSSPPQDNGDVPIPADLDVFVTIVPQAELMMI